MAEENITRDGFIFYRSFFEAIRELPRDIQGEVLTSIIDYGLNGVTTENLNPVARAMFTLVKPQLDANNKKFINGKKGGRKPNDNLNETKQKPNDNQNITKPEPKEKEKEKENVKEKDNVNDVLLEKEPKEKKIEKKVLEDDSDKISEEQERKKVAPKKESLEMPEEFFPIWEDWIDYRKARKLKPYAATKYEQIAVNKLLELSNKDPTTAKKILEQTYQNNYQGFFELKENYGKSIISTGTNANNTSSRQATFNIREASERLAADFETGNILGVYKK